LCNLRVVLMLRLCIFHLLSVIEMQLFSMWRTCTVFDKCNTIWSNFNVETLTSSQTLVHYLVFQSFNVERHPRKVITVTCCAHQIWYLRFYYMMCLTCILYGCNCTINTFSYRTLLLQNVDEMSRLVLLGLLAYIAVQCNGLSIERREVLADLDDGNLKSKSMFGNCRHPRKVITVTCCAHQIWYLRFYYMMCLTCI
jgi:hypothetical protein